MIDTHIHLDSIDFANDLMLVLERARNAGIESFIIPAASIHTLKEARNIAASNNDVYYAVGIHPCHIDEIYPECNTFIESNFNKQTLQILQNGLESKKCKAVGECGLDFYRLENGDTKIMDLQIKAFCMQIELAIQNDLPLILHVRDSRDNKQASREVANILSSYLKKNQNLRGVFHCYNACDILLDFSSNFYYGIGGIVTFKNANELLEITPQIPISRIVLETDAPYLAPAPHRGKRNESSFLIHIAEKLSNILNIDINGLIKTTTNNAKELFKIHSYQQNYN